MIDALLRHLLMYVMPLNRLKRASETISEAGQGHGSLNVNNGSKASKGN